MKTSAPKANDTRMIFQLIMSFVFPPLAVLERGCGTVMLVSLLTVMGWFPGMLLALYITLVDKPTGKTNRQKKFIQIPLGADGEDEEVIEDEPKRKGAYIRLADGEVAEVVEDEGTKGEKHKRGL